MDEKITKMVVLPQDGSPFALRSLDYIDLIFGPEHDLTPVLMHILPSLPPVLVEEGRRNKDTAEKLKQIGERNEKMGDSVLKKAKDVLIECNFDPEKIKTVSKKRKLDIARDIAAWSEDKLVDGVVLCSHGRSRIEAFFMGEVSMKLLECSERCPVWMLRGHVKDKNALIAIDNSDSAFRAVDYAGFMLNGTQSRITLFHGKKKLRRFFPKAIFEDIPGIEDLLLQKEEEEIGPVMEKAKEMLIKAGIEEEKINIEIISGTRNPAKDILETARKNGCGTIVLGRKGDSGDSGFFLGSFTRKVLEGVTDMAIWIV